MRGLRTDVVERRSPAVPRSRLRPQGAVGEGFASLVLCVSGYVFAYRLAGEYRVSCIDPGVNQTDGLATAGSSTDTVLQLELSEGLIGLDRRQAPLVLEVDLAAMRIRNCPGAPLRIAPAPGTRGRFRRTPARQPEAPASGIGTVDGGSWAAGLARGVDPAGGGWRVWRWRWRVRCGGGSGVGGIVVCGLASPLPPPHAETEPRDGQHQDCDLGQSRHAATQASHPKRNLQPASTLR